MKPKVDIRPAEKSDFEKIQELNQLLFHHDYQFDKTLNLDWSKSEEGINYYKGKLKSDDSCVLIAFVDDKAVGYLMGGLAETVSYKKDKSIGELENMFVLEEYRNLEIGSQLVNIFIEWCRLKKINRIRTVASAANKKAINFYRKWLDEYSLTLEGDI